MIKSQQSFLRHGVEILEYINCRWTEERIGCKSYCCIMAVIKSRLLHVNFTEFVVWPYSERCCVTCILCSASYIAHKLSKSLAMIHNILGTCRLNFVICC